MIAMSRLPSLGPRGEGWVVLQGVLLVAIALCGLLPPAWGGAARLVSGVAGTGLVAVGCALAVAGMRDLRANLTPLPHPRDGATLVESGVYALVRHPIYGGLIIAATGWGLLIASVAALILAAVLFAFFDLKSRREEAWLEDRFADYPAYRRRTRRLIPFLY
jgi:protein-S-isoprenylcysteine O-methyltransferase Ste14